MTTDPRIAALAEALHSAYPHRGTIGVLCFCPSIAAAILAALPPDWCGHEAEIAHLNGVILRQHDCDHSDCIDREERLRKIEEAARAHIAWEYRVRGAPQFTLTMLRAALEAER